MAKLGTVAAATAGLLAAVAGGAGSPAVAGSPDGSRALRAGVEDLRDLGMVGVQGQVTTGRWTALARAGVADRDTGARMPADGRFRIGSSTKTFVAVVVLQLVAEGRLSLDDTVERWLPGVVAGNGNDGRAVTVRHLLQQTSGLFDFAGTLPVLAGPVEYERHRYDHHDPADLVATAMARPPLFAPGTRWEYSNTNYILAGMIISKVTGRPWATEVRDRIVRPLGLRATYYPGDDPLPARPHARAYEQHAPDGPLTDVTALNATAGDAAGGLVGTTDDLARFWRALQRGDLLPPRQMRAMHDTVLADAMQDVMPGLRYGLGIFWAPARCGGYWTHPGDIPGTSVINGVTTDGGKVVVVYRTTRLADPAADVRAIGLVEDVICGQTS